MVDVCFYVHVHQPYRIRRFSFFDIGSEKDYFDVERNLFYLDRVARKCYLKANDVLLDLINSTNGKFKMSFSITGVLLEQLEEYFPRVLDSFRALVDTGCVELVGETYYHSLAFIYSIPEFVRQVKLQESKLYEIFKYKPITFRNTELVYSDELGKLAEKLGYRVVLIEGHERILGWRSPNYVYKAKGAEVFLLPRHYRLSDDIAFRFSRMDWSGYPLTAEKFATWIHESGGDVVNVFLDYETFGEHQWEESGIFQFLKRFPLEVLDRGDNFELPSTIVKKCPPRGEISVPLLMSWADIERDLSAWLGNRMQIEAMKNLYALEELVLSSGDPKLIEEWRKLQISDHFYYMCTKYFSDGDVHKYFNPYDTPYEAFVNFMNVLHDLRVRLERLQVLKRKNKRELAVKYLSDVHPSKVFYCKDGRVIKNLRELYVALVEMDESIYSYHVSSEKNDFAKWIEEVVGDVTLARRLRKAKNKKQAANLVKQRIKWLLS